MFCPKCGAQVGDNDKFCKACGTPVNVQPVAPTPITQQPPVSQQPACNLMKRKPAERKKELSLE